MATATMPRIAPRHLVYLDETRTHEVHAEVEAAVDEDRLVTTEFPAGSRDPAEAVQLARRVTAEAEVEKLLAELETRLRLTGNYFRADAADMRWTALGPPATGARVDLRAIELPLPGAPSGAKISFHHFHAGGEDRMLIHMPRLDTEREQHVLAELAFRFPTVETGDLRLLHTRLTPTTLRTSLVQRHLDLPRQGYGKLLEPGDYQRVYGDEWQAATRAVFGGAAARMVAVRPEGPLLTHGGADAHPRLPEVRVALRSPRVATLKARFMEPGEATNALSGGEHGIRRLVNAKRRQLPHTASYELSILEAALLLEFAVSANVFSLVEEEAEKMLRFVNGYR